VLPSVPGERVADSNAHRPPVETNHGRIPFPV
jgi:hypothetical protein